jgi:hypothetical protein
MHREMRDARAALGSAAARAARNPDNPDALAAVIERRRAYRAIALEDQVRRALVEEPALNPSQRERLAALLLTSGQEVASVS